MIRVPALLSLLVLGSGPSFAAGLSTSFGEVLVENLQIGRSYNLKDLIGLPLRVRNEVDEPVEIEMKVRKPKPAVVKKGYEPIPDLSWVRLEKTSHTILPGEEAVSNIFLTIPRDRKLKGKRFEVRLESRAIPAEKAGMGLSVGMSSRFIFTISRVEGPPGGGDFAKVFAVAPTDLFLPGVPVGERIHSGARFGKSLKVFNPNDFSCSYEVKSIAVSGSKTKVRKGFEVPPDWKFLSIDEPVFRVPPHAEKTVFMFIDIPDKPRYRGKNYMFLVETLQRTGSPKIKVYNRVYVFTEE